MFHRRDKEINTLKCKVDKLNKDCAVLTKNNDQLCGLSNVLRDVLKKYVTKENKGHWGKYVMVLSSRYCAQINVCVVLLHLQLTNLPSQQRIIDQNKLPEKPHKYWILCSSTIFFTFLEMQPYLLNLIMNQWALGTVLCTQRPYLPINFHPISQSLLQDATPWLQICRRVRRNGDLKCWWEDKAAILALLILFTQRH